MFDSSSNENCWILNEDIDSFNGYLINVVHAIDSYLPHVLWCVRSINLVREKHILGYVGARKSLNQFLSRNMRRCKYTMLPWMKGDVQSIRAD